MKKDIIFDTSVWIELIQKQNTPKALLLREYIEDNKPVWLIIFNFARSSARHKKCSTVYEI